MRYLHLGSGIKIPETAITETFGLLAVRGAGKSNAAAVMAEEMYRLRLPFVVVDPVAAWWGLRSSKNGKGAGLSIPIFGGRRGDVPLERHGGNLIADLVVDQRLSCILDLSEFESENAKKQFLADFGARLYRRNEAPLHLFLEEADDYIPQKPRGHEELLRVFGNLVRRGRQRGLGITLITQRSAAINKDVLTQVQTLIPMRITSPHDRKAIQEWVKYHGQSEEIMASLSELENGEAWIWSPHFLRLTKRVQFRQRATFDSGATPTMAKRMRKAARLADVDLNDIQQRMADTIERSKNEDPVALWKVINNLESELQKRPTPALPVKTPKIVKVSLLSKPVERRLVNLVRRLTSFNDQINAMGAEIRSAVEFGRKEPATAVITKTAPSGAVFVTRKTERPVQRIVENNGNMQAGERAILTAVVQHGVATKSQIMLLTGYRPTSIRTYLGNLSQKKYVELRGDDVKPTLDGETALGPYEKLPTGEALYHYWREKLSAGESKILDVVWRYGSDGISSEAIQSETGYKATSVRTYVGNLAGRKLVTSARGTVTPSVELYDH